MSVVFMDRHVLPPCQWWLPMSATVTRKTTPSTVYLPETQVPFLAWWFGGHQLQLSLTTGVCEWNTDQCSVHMHMFAFRFYKSLSYFHDQHDIQTCPLLNIHANCYLMWHLTDCANRFRMHGIMGLRVISNIFRTVCLQDWKPKSMPSLDIHNIKMAWRLICEALYKTFHACILLQLKIFIVYHICNLFLPNFK